MSRILKNKNNLITNKFSNTHKGIDIVGEGYSLDYIVAHTSGIITSIEKNYKTQDRDGNSYGNYIKIKHDNGYYTLYSHLKYGSINLNKGDKVEKGETIGYMGSTGHSTGPHLHFEVRDKNDNKIDPTNYINNNLPNSKENSSEENNTTYIVKKGDTLSEIALKFNTTYQEIAKLNNISNPNLIRIGEKLVINNTSYYIVKSGDNLSSIAKKYNTTWQKIYNDNKKIIGDNANIIIPGQKLIIKKDA